MNNNLIDKWINEGATLNKDLQPIKNKNGFMCSILGYEKTFKPEEKEKIKETILYYKSILKSGQFVGIWKHEELVYIDISRLYVNKQDAIKNGIINKQLAIYDLKNRKDIELTKTVYIVYYYNKYNNDIRFRKEFKSIKDLEKATKKPYYTLKNYIINSIDKPIKELLFNKYLIIKENAFIRDLEG